jgi:hypothetical protein
MTPNGFLNRCPVTLVGALGQLPKVPGYSGGKGLWVSGECAWQSLWWCGPILTEKKSARLLWWEEDLFLQEGFSKVPGYSGGSARLLWWEHSL